MRVRAMRIRSSIKNSPMVSKGIKAMVWETIYLITSSKGTLYMDKSTLQIHKMALITSIEPTQTNTETNLNK
jgi:hypothetical protein